jgi:hypothetical protein
MRKPLGEVSEQLARVRVDLLREQPKVVRSGHRPIEHMPRIVELTLVHQTLHQPERTAQKRSLASRKPVTSTVAIEKPVTGVELFPDRRGRPQHPLVAPVDELHRRQQQQRRIHFGAIERLHEYATLTVIAATLDRFAQLGTSAVPPAQRRTAQAFVREADPSIERGPAQNLRMDELLGLPRPLPYPAVRLFPLLGRAVDQGDQESPVVIARRVTAPVPAPRQVDKFPVGIELALRCGAVADAYRGRSAPAPEHGKFVGLEPPLAADSVGDLEIVRVTGGGAHDERSERVGLLLRSKLDERPRAEARVAHPCVAVIPVANPAADLGQRGVGAATIEPVGS